MAGFRKRNDGEPRCKASKVIRDVERILKEKGFKG
jgi:hypothetical protein